MKLFPKLTHHKTGAQKQAGFSLIENIVSVVLLAIGGVAIAANTATTIKVNTDNQARAMALSVATKTLEPVYLSARDPYPQGTGVADIQSVIKRYVARDAVAATATRPAVTASRGVTVYGNVAAGASDGFVVSITQAVDDAGTNVLTTAGPYISPLRIAVLVSYDGIAGRTSSSGEIEISDLKQVRTGFTYVLGN